MSSKKKTKTEKPNGKERDVLQLYKIRRLNEEVSAAAAIMAEKQSQFKSAKGRYDGALESLRDAIRERDEDRPLIKDVASTFIGDWRSLPIGSLGFAKPTIKKLATLGITFNTVGEFTAYIEGHETWMTDIKTTEREQAQIVAKFEEFWKEHPRETVKEQP